MKDSNDFPATTEAYIEARNNAYHPEFWRPSHQAVLEAARRTGFGILANRRDKATKRTFGEHYFNVCNAYLRGERFKPYSKPKREIVSANEFQNRRALGLDRLQGVREILGGNHG